MTRVAPADIRRKRLAVLALLTLHAVLLAWGAWRKGLTVDEPGHLASGVYHWRTGRFDLNRGNPPLTGLVSALPVLGAGPKTDWSSIPAHYTVARQFLEANGPRTCWLVRLGSWALIPFSLLGGYICYRWATDLYGDASGLMALALWTFSPSTIAYGPLITGDMPATAMGVAAAYCFWKWLCQPEWNRAVIAGLTLGSAELAKFVWVILYGLWPVLWMVWFFATCRQPGTPRWYLQSAQLGTILLLGLYVINLGYAFDGTFGKLGDYHVGRLLLDSCLTSSESGEEGSNSVLARLPVPLPKDYIGGVDEIAQLSAQSPHTFLRRTWRTGGYWYYYIYAILMKMPVGVLLLAAVAGILTVVSWRADTDWKSEFILLSTSLAVLVFVSSSGVSQTFRYVLPFLPYVLIWISKTARVVYGRGPWQARTVLALLVWAVLSATNTYPHSLGYFNEMAGGPAKGHAHLISPDADWGQDFLDLKRWMNRHPEASPMGMTWSHYMLDPKWIGIDYVEVPPGVVADRNYSLVQLLELGPQPGWYAINVSALRSRGGEYAYFHYFEPVGHAGYSIQIYHITIDEANCIRRELGLPKLLLITASQEKARK